MLATEHAPYRFTAKEGHAGEHAIALEPLDANLSILSQFAGILALKLKPGLTIYDARALARLLNDRVEGLAATST